MLRAGARQVLWALLLVYCILTGIAFLFGPSAGYEISFGVCLGLAVLVTAAFGAVFLLDRASALMLHALERVRDRRKRRRR